MDTQDAASHFAALEEKVPLPDYNYEHFRTKHLLEDGRRTVTDRGVIPGELAPDFALPQAGGDVIRLSELRGAPVLLHFGSYT